LKLSPTRAKLRATKGGLLRQDPSADTTEVDQQIKAARASEYVQRLVDEAPPLTELQRARLAALLLGGRRDEAMAS
jgi:hypothetical protein